MLYDLEKGIKRLGSVVIMLSWLAVATAALANPASDTLSITTNRNVIASPINTDSVKLSASDKNDQVGITPTDAQALAAQFLGRKDITLTQHGFRRWAGARCYHLDGPIEESLSLDVATTGNIIQFYWGRLQTQSQRIIFSQQEAAGVAETFLHKRANFTFSPNIKMSQAALYDHGSAGKVYHFRWGKIIGGVQYPFELVVEVSAQTDEVTAYHLFDFTVALPSLTPKISKEQAITLAMPKIDLEPGYKTEALLSVSSPVVGQTLQWHISARGKKISPYTPERGEIEYDAITEVVLDGTTGRVVSAETFHAEPPNEVLRKPPVARPDGIIAADFWPSWASQKPDTVLFYIWREMEKGATVNDSAASAIHKTDAPRAMLATVKDGKITDLLATPPFLIHYPAWTPDGNRIAFDMWLGDVIYILDVKAGSIGQCNDGQRLRREMPSWDSTGKLLVMAGTFSGDHDSEDDIFVAKIVDKLSRVSMDRNWCIAKMPGQDILPVFSPDSQYVVFAHQDPIKPNATQSANNWSLYRVKSDKSYKDKDYEPPQKIADNLPMPERLSFFPDGKRILVSYSDTEYEMKNPPEVVAIEAKTHKPLNLPTLHDPDLPKSQPLIVREPAIDPTGTKIAFRALRWSGNPKDDGAICIYTCNLDGSDLKRITPPTAQPLEPYNYPQPGITALNAWEKLEPKPNLGTPVSQAATTH